MIRNALLMRAMGIKPKTIIHIGAHLGQDHLQYKKLGAETIVWGDAIIDNVNIIKNRYPDAQVLHKLFWSEPEIKIEFHILKNKQSSSIFAPSKSQEEEQVLEITTSTVDLEIDSSKLPQPIMFVLDVQGAELEVLKGSKQLLNTAKYVICEITEDAEETGFLVSDAGVMDIVENFHFKRSIKRESYSRTYYDRLYVKSGRISRFRIDCLDSIWTLFRSVKKFVK